MSLIVHVSVGMPKVPGWMASRDSSVHIMIVFWFFALQNMFHDCFMGIQGYHVTTSHKTWLIVLLIGRHFFWEGSFRVLWVFEVWTCVSGNCLIPANTTEIAKVNPHKHLRWSCLLCVHGGLLSLLREFRFFLKLLTLQFNMFATFIHPLSNILWKDLLNGSCCSRVVSLEDEISFRDRIFSSGDVGFRECNVKSITKWWFVVCGWFVQGWHHWHGRYLASWNR